jgi:hypothetical protein
MPRTPAEIRLLNAVTEAYGAQLEILHNDRAHAAKDRLEVVAVLRASNLEYYRMLRALLQFRDYLCRGGSHDLELHAERPQLQRLERRLKAPEIASLLRLSRLNREQQQTERYLATAASPLTTDSEAHAAMELRETLMASHDRLLRQILDLVADISDKNRGDAISLQLEAAKRAKEINPSLDLVITHDVTDELGRRRVMIDDTPAGEDVRATEGFMFPIFPGQRIYNDLAKWSCQLWLPDGEQSVWRQIETVCSREGDFVEHMTGAMQMALTHHIWITDTAAERRHGSQLSGLATGEEGVTQPLIKLQQNYVEDKRTPISLDHRHGILSAFGDSWFDVDIIQALALESPDERALWMKALLLYMSHLLPGMLSRDRDFQAYGPHPSEAAQLFHLFRTAYTTAEFCAEATARRSHGGDGAAGLISKAQAAVSRAGLFLSERPEAWRDVGEDLVRDVSMPFFLTSGLNAEGEGKVYSGKTDIHFRLGDLGATIWQRGVAEFKKWDGVGTFRQAWRQLTVEHATGHEDYLICVLLYYGMETQAVVDAVNEELAEDGLSGQARYKGSGTLAGVDGHVAVRGSSPIPYGIYVYELGYGNPRHRLA